MTTDLKPCPFCGGEANHNNGGNSTFGRFWWAVWCENCQFELRDREVWSKEAVGKLDAAYPPKECFARWNARPNPKVKPLVWVERRNNTLEAGAYQIRFSQPGVYRVAFNGKIVCRSINGIHAAKTWADNHNRDRILEALE